MGEISVGGDDTAIVHEWTSWRKGSMNGSPSQTDKLTFLFPAPVHPQRAPRPQTCRHACHWPQENDLGWLSGFRIECSRKATMHADRQPPNCSPAWLMMAPPVFCPPPKARLMGGTSPAQAGTLLQAEQPSTSPHPLCPPSQALRIDLLSFYDSRIDSHQYFHRESCRIGTEVA